MARKLQFKRGIKSKLPTLSPGEPGFVTDEGKLYIGTGAVNIPMARDDHTHTAAGIGAQEPIKDSSTKDTPVDADSIAITDSAQAGATKRVLWSRVKAVLKGYFDTLYAAVSHRHAWSNIDEKPGSFPPSAHTQAWGTITDAPSAYTPTGHKASHKTGGADALAASDIGAAVIFAQKTVTFTTAGWVQNANGSWYQTVTCSGLLTTDLKNIMVSPVGSTDPAAQKLTDEACALVKRFSCDTAGKLTARCDDGKPAVNFQVAVAGVR